MVNRRSTFFSQDLLYLAFRLDHIFEKFLLAEELDMTNMLVVYLFAIHSGLVLFYIETGRQAQYYSPEKIAGIFWASALTEDAALSGD